MTRTSCNPKLSSSSLIYQVREQLVDSRKDVDWQLKKTCEEFIHLAVSSLVSPIRHFLEKATYLVGEQKTDDKKSAASFASEVSTSTATSVKPLRLQPFATPEKVWITSRKIKDLTYVNDLLLKRKATDCVKTLYHRNIVAVFWLGLPRIAVLIRVADSRRRCSSATRPKSLLATVAVGN